MSRFALSFKSLQLLSRGPKASERSRHPSASCPLNSLDMGLGTSEYREPLSPKLLSSYLEDPGILEMQGGHTPSPITPGPRVSGCPVAPAPREQADTTGDRLDGPEGDMGVPQVLGRLACREESGSRWHLCHPFVTCCHPFHHCDVYVTHASDVSPILPAYHPLTSSTAATCITMKLSILARSSTCRASRSVLGTR